LRFLIALTINGVHLGYGVAFHFLESYEWRLYLDFSVVVLITFIGHMYFSGLTRQFPMYTPGVGSLARTMPFRFWLVATLIIVSLLGFSITLLNG